MSTQRNSTNGLLPDRHDNQMTTRRQIQTIYISQLGKINWYFSPRGWNLSSDTARHFGLLAYIRPENKRPYLNTFPL